MRTMGLARLRRSRREGDESGSDRPNTILNIPPPRPDRFESVARGRRNKPRIPSRLTITSSISKGYAWRLIIIAAASVGLGIWGVYDYAVGIPRQKRAFERFETVTAEIDTLESKSKQQGTLEPEDEAAYLRLKQELMQLGSPTPPGKYDRVIKGLLFVPCLPFGPYLLWMWFRTNRRTYRLDDDGTLHLPEGSWNAQDIKEIDMTRWMSKSIAHVVHTDGTRAKLDDFQHKDLHLIVGAIASRIQPQEWTPDARPVTAETEPGASAKPPEAEATG